MQAVTRRRKFVTAGGILVLGVLLAWPFRKSAHDAQNVPTLPEVPAATLQAPNGDRVARMEPTPMMPTAPGQINAQMASSVYASEVAESVPPQSGFEYASDFDIANHPALAARTGSVSSGSRESTSNSATAPAYETAASAVNLANEPWPAELVHVVANGDTLEKLAERYLSNAGRALEIFDLNRDQLSNPHLLPIGVELRIPRNPERIID